MKQQMKTGSRWLGFLISLVLAGCYGEDFSGCPPTTDERSVTLRFELGGQYNDDAFTERVTSVNVGIYNHQGDSIGNRQITADELGRFPGVKLNLPTGNYHFVCWGNVDDEDDDDGMITYDDRKENVTEAENRQSHGLLNAIYDAGDCDALWNGQARDVTINDDYDGSVTFLPKYWEVEAFVKGSDGPVVVELLGLPEGTDVETALVDGQKITSSYEMTNAIQQAGETYQLADFRTFRFNPYDNEVTIRITTSADGHELYAAKLQDVAPKELDLNEDIILPLLFTITPTEDGKDVNVEVSVPDWESEDTGYGW
ncbi:MAG: FimB/Mfa2 family fimbrial subunit [Prevotellaceae bacterium]|jgi:hypothetical protein|nr:FimB/Mfa2 family fimbrial subunit [Prevotellaceae bacterium]